jgi:hypothetical protein
MVRHTLCVAVLVAIAATTLGCRREIPEPRGLGAADIAAQQTVAK